MNQNKKWTHRTDDEKRAMVKTIEERIEKGATAPEACREEHIAASQFYRWRRTLEGKPEGDSRIIKTKNTNNEKALRVENQRLKMIVAEYALDIQALKEWGAR